MQQYTKNDQPNSLEQRNDTVSLFHLSVAAWSWIAVAGLAIAEVLIAYGDRVLGVTLHALLLIGFLGATSRSQGAVYRFLVVLLLLPLIRLLSLALPLTAYPTLWWYSLLFVPLLLATLAAIRAAELTLSDLVLHWPGRGIVLQLLVGLSGFGLAQIAYPFLYPRLFAADLSLGALWLPALGLLLTGMLEELIFRGLLLQTAASILGKWGAILYVTLIFTTFYLGERSLPVLLLVFAIGFFYSWFVATTQNLWGVILSHGLINLGLVLIYYL